MFSYSVRDCGFLGKPFEFSIGWFHLFGTWGGVRFAYRWQICLGNHFCFKLAPERLATYLLIRAVRKNHGGC